MFKFVVLLSAVACALGAAVPEGLLPQLDGRIVGGVATTISNFPWQISLQRSGSHSCGGSIISEYFIVTAAHCLDDDVSPSVLRIRAGSSYRNLGGVVIPVAAYKNHEGYNSRTKANDISVIRLSAPLNFSSNIRSIPLATVTPEDGAEAVVSGWGTMKSGASSLPNQLQMIDLTIVGRSECSSKNFSYGKLTIKKSMICAYDDGKDSCQGDSGGPLVSDGELVGVVSWGYGCADKRYPGVYADVAGLLEWVNEAVETV